MPEICDLNPSGIQVIGQFVSHLSSVKLRSVGKILENVEMIPAEPATIFLTDMWVF